MDADALTAADLLRGQPLSFNRGWRFLLGEPPDHSARLDRATLRPWLLPATSEFCNYAAHPPRRPAGPEPGADLAFVQPGFDDGSWRPLDLPHDWGVEGSFDQSLPGETGKLPWHGVAWYRKRFTPPREAADRRLYLDIDGAMSHAVVWLNGRLVGGWPCGYTSFRLDLTPHIRVGAENTLAVRLDNPPASSRWYPGGGIYRNVWLVAKAPIHVSHWGVFVTTPRVDADSAVVDVRLEMENHQPDNAKVGVDVAIHLLGPDGAPAADPLAVAPAQDLELKPGATCLTSFNLALAHPKLWRLDDPRLHLAVVTVRRDGKQIDRHETRFGIRSLSVDAARGLFINGERVRIQGVCLHHDLGALGAALHLRAVERQLEILREMGVNAIRTSHNPPAPELLDLCDRMGLLVAVEAFDCWAIGKAPRDYSHDFPDWHEADLRAMVRRDRNHSCVVFWSIGNEMIEQTVPDGWKLAARLAGLVREEDRSRPVTGGFSYVSSGYNGFQTAVDVVGYNYKPGEYARFLERHSAIPVLGSETSSTLSSRGEYFFPVTEDPAGGGSDFQVSSYDLYAPSWATTPDTEFAALDRTPAVLGEFVWTGFDYLGEPTPYNSDATNLLNYSDPAARARAEEQLRALGRVAVPSRSSYFGLVDLAGFPKDRYYLYQARWRPDLPMAHLLPHWTWPGREGETTPVHLYTSGDEAELFLNGRALGRKRRGPFEYRLRWNEVVYEPGELKVVAYKDGRRWAEAVQRTAGPAARIELSADRARLAADGADLAFVTARVTDAAGVLVPQAKNLLVFELDGPGRIIATDNGDATSHESFRSSRRHAYNGLALAIVRPAAGGPATLTLRVRSEGLASASVDVHVG